MKNNNINEYADAMIEKISQCIQEASNGSLQLVSAIVQRVNTDNTIDINIPPDNSHFTKISNQTPFKLKAGDAVEVLLKNGNYNNCWIVAKHQTTFNENNYITREEFDKTIEELKNLINK